ncbi:MAG: Transcriptional regulator [Rhodocyclales bacterium]|nr:Transcriptional regulator [Rhodocyclales bacterium]
MRQSDVAKIAGVSPSTVSKVISGSPGISQQVRDRVLKAIQDIGFPVAEARLRGSLQARRVKLVTFYQFLVQDSNYFHAETLHSIRAECEKQGLQIDTVLLSRDEPNDQQVYRAQLAEGQSDGIIFVGIDSAEFLDAARESGLPTVIVNGNDPECVFDSVSPSFRDGSRLATRYLIEQGHREIVHVTHLYRRFIHRRLEGFREAIEDAGIEFSFERNVINVDYSPMFSAENAAEAVYERITSGKMKATAFFCVTDYTAFGVIQGIKRAGFSVPDDYSVVSFDDLPLAQVCRPAITAVGVDREALGRLSAQRLMERIQNDPTGPSLRLEIGPRLTVRDSVRLLSVPEVKEP